MSRCTTTTRGAPLQLTSIAHYICADPPRDASETLPALVKACQYQTALRLAVAFRLPCSSVLEGVASQCVHSHGSLPEPDVGGTRTLVTRRCVAVAFVSVCQPQLLPLLQQCYWWALEFPEDYLQPLSSGGTARVSASGVSQAPLQQRCIAPVVSGALPGQSMALGVITWYWGSHGTGGHMRTDPSSGDRCSGAVESPAQL